MAKKKNNAFTIVELLVAMSLLVILLGLSGMVFNTTVEAHRTAGASIDITRSLRAITDQLNRDFRGLRKDTPLTIWFEQDADGQRYDQIQFFADGDFQTTKQYAGQTVFGNVARIYYGHGWVVDLALQTGETSRVIGNYTDAGTLARRTHLFTSDMGLPLVNNDPLNNLPFPPIDQVNNLLIVMLQSHNNFFEYDQLMTVGLWKVLLSNGVNCDTYLSSCFVNALPVFDGLQPDFVQSGRPSIDFGDIRHLHTLLSQGVLQMQIQWAYTNDDLIDPGTGVMPNPPLFAGVRWWPDVDPDSNGNVSDSDFNTMGGSQGGAYFNMPGGTTVAGWYSIGNCSTAGVGFNIAFYPKALKFKFTLRDRNGIFPDGKTFTHIVYLDN